MARDHYPRTTDSSPTFMNPLKTSGDTDPDFASLIEEVRPRLRAFLLSLTGSQSASEDLTQDTSIVLWDKREEYDPSGDFRAWAFQIAFNQARNHRRRMARQQIREVPGEELFDQIAEAATTRHGSSDLEEYRKQALITCLGKLREPHRNLILSRYQDERSLKQLATEAGTNRNAMAQKLFRLKRTLFRCIEKQLPVLKRTQPDLPAS